MNTNIKMGTLGSQYNNGKTKSITFCVTEDCNLRCKYCYMEGKNSSSIMSFETAKKAVDFFLSQEVVDEAVVWEFIGGEPTIEIELIDKISDYIKLQMYTLNHPWFNKYMFSMSTNGLLYSSEKVQNYIKKNHSHLSIGISIDGTKEKHDLQRVKVDGSGSYDDVIKSIPLWLEQFPLATTKVTFASEDLRYLKESIVHLWNLGLKIIPANIVYEDVWAPGDDEIFENQLIELADYILENKLWMDYSVRFFDPHTSLPLTEYDKSVPFCGAGKMAAVDHNGDLYPCVRFLDFCSGTPLITGNIDRGYDGRWIELFKHVNTGILNDGECETCQVASGCFSCSGNNYACSETNSIFIRTKFHCQMHKAQSRANRYFWDRLLDYIDDITPFELNRLQKYKSSGWSIKGAKYLYFLMSNEETSHCMYNTPQYKSRLEMSVETLDQGLAYAYKNDMIPVFLGDPGEKLSKKESRKLHVVIANADLLSAPRSEMEVLIPVVNNAKSENCIHSDICIYQFNKNSLGDLYNDLIALSANYRRINIKPQDLDLWNEDDIENYKVQIDKYNEYRKENYVANLNILGTANDNYCLAGTNDLTLAPNGKFYICPAFYHNFTDDDIGDIENGIYVKDPILFSNSKTADCGKCNVNCMRCKYINIKCTYAINIPADIQCKLAQV